MSAISGISVPVDHGAIPLALVALLGRVRGSGRFYGANIIEQGACQGVIQNLDTGMEFVNSLKKPGLAAATAASHRQPN
jgi:hypothetical protein